MKPREKPTFDQLPDAVHWLCQEWRELKPFLDRLIETSEIKKDQWFDLNQLVAYDPEKRSKDTFYGYVHFRKIPHHKSGRKLIFLKSEIDAWLASGLRKTIKEVQAEALDRMAEMNKRRVTR